MANLESVRGIQHQYTVMSPQMMHTALADSMQHLAPVSLSNHVLCTPPQQINPSTENLDRTGLLDVNRSEDPPSPYHKAVGEEHGAVVEAHEQRLL